MEAHQPGALGLRAETILHYAIPDLARGAVFRDLLKKIIVRVEEEAQARPEFVDIQSSPACPLHVFDAIVQRESQLLQRGRSRLANVIPADRNGVETRREFRSKLKSVDYQSHRRRRRI